MSQYNINEGYLIIPPSWQDRSLNIFTIPANGRAKEASFLISRDVSQGGRSFTAFITDQIEQCRQQLSRFKLVKRNDYVQPYSHSSIEYTWETGERTVLLRQIFVESTPANIIFTLTTTPQDIAIHEAAWREVMSSVMPNTVVTEKKPSAD